MASRWPVTGNAPKVCSKAEWSTTHGWVRLIDTLEAANRTLHAFASITADLLADAPEPVLGELGEQFRQTADQAGNSAAALMAATVMWTRMHGVVSLEVVGQFRHMHIDAALLLRREIDAVISDINTGRAS